MLWRAPAGRLLRRGRGQMGEAAKGRRCWCGGHRDRRPSFFFRGLPARGEARGKVPLWGRGWTLGADGSAAPPDTAHLGGETAGSGVDGGAALPDTARLGGETVGSGADGGVAPPDGPLGRGRRPGWEWMVALPFRTACLGGGRRPGREQMAALPFRTARLGGETVGMGADGGAAPYGHGPPGRGRRPRWERAGFFRGRRGGLFPWGRLRSGQGSL